MELDTASFSELLKQFYSRVFPCNEYYKWLKYYDSKGQYFAKREFSFTLENDIYLRFQSFEDCDEFKKKLVELCPHKIDIGAVYSSKPKNKKTTRPAAFAPVEKELVFDIDMTDYDEIRTCCTGGAICPKCWSFMTISIKILHRALTEDFGFKHLLWIYSGRRGVHCWIADERARKVSNEGRSAIVKYLEVVKGGENQTKKVNLPTDEKLHPSLIRSLSILKEYFIPVILQNQSVLSTKAQYEKVLALLPEPVRKTLESKWDTEMEVDSDEQKSSISSIERWKQISQVVAAEKEKVLDGIPGKQRNSSKVKDYNQCLRDTIFQYTYPRLDDKVSTHINHLLKSPFCVHPKTGRVCVPIDPDDCDNFDPFSVPTISQVIDELADYNRSHGENEDTENEGARKTKEWEKTSLKPYLRVFEKFLKGLEKEQAAKLKDEANKLDF